VVCSVCFNRVLFCDGLILDEDRSMFTFVAGERSAAVSTRDVPRSWQELLLLVSLFGRSDAILVVGANVIKKPSLLVAWKLTIVCGEKR
jgi:hypothetical protein